MIHEALKGKKLVFDVKGKPELGRAIVARLHELGANWAQSEEDYYPRNPAAIHYSMGREHMITFASMPLHDVNATLSDLYDLQAVRPQTITVDRDTIIYAPFGVTITIEREAS